MKFISLFAGIGGFDLALIRQGHECVWANEWDKYAAQIYDKNFNDANKNREQESIGERTIGEHIRHTGDIPNSNVWRGKSKQKEGHRLLNGLYISKSKNYETKIDQRDIRTVPTSDIPDHDLLVGGFPCQAFSIAGKRKGFDDTRGTLFFEIARILREKHPRLFILENVKGLLSHDNGNTFKTIISTLDELGYDLQWQVLNSKNFGVPQNRERVFIVGHLRGTSRPKVFPIGGDDKEIDTTQKLSEPISNYLRTNYSNGKSNETYIKQLQGGSQGNRIYDPSGISTTIASQAGGLGAKTGLYAIPVLTPDRINKRQNGRRFKEDGDPSFTLTGQDKHGVMIGDILERKKDSIGRNRPINYAKNLGNGMRIRRLTPTECERLQGFPDGWTEGVSDTQRYKCLGNAVTVNVVEYIVKNLNQL